MKHNKRISVLKDNIIFSSILFGSVILLVVFIVVAILSGAWPGTDVYSQILAALAGAIVAAIITMFLLIGQTANEEKKERNAKIFEERLRIYNEFLQKLCDVVCDMKIEKSEEIQLEFQVAQIAMHTSSESILTISDQVREIIIKIKNGTPQSNEMLAQLFVIADTFYKELYGKSNEYSDKERDMTVGNFSSIMLTKENIENYEEQQKQTIIDSYKGYDNLSLSERIKLLKAMINKGGSKQWIYNGKVLVHEFYTDIDKNTNSYINTNNRIAIDMTPNDKHEYVITVFVRSWDKEAIKKIATDIWGVYTPYDVSGTRHLYKTIPFSSGNDYIAEEMNKLLIDVQNYRNKHFPLK